MRLALKTFIAFFRTHAGAIIGASATLLAAFIGYMSIDKSATPEFVLNGVRFNPDSTIKIGTADKKISKEPLVLSLDGYRVYDLYRIEKSWTFSPKKSGLPKEVLSDGKHELTIRLSGDVEETRFNIYFDSIAPNLEITKNYQDDSELSFIGKAIDSGAYASDTLKVEIFLFDGDNYTRTQLPVTEYQDASGLIIYGFQIQISNVPIIGSNDPRYSMPFCKIKVSDKAKNIASYELPYSQATAKGFSRTTIGDTEITIGRPVHDAPELSPVRFNIHVPNLSNLAPTEEPHDEFMLVIHVYSKNYAKIGVRNLPKDAQGEISYYRNNVIIDKSKDLLLIDTDIKSGEQYEYYATVFGSSNRLHKSNSVFLDLLRPQRTNEIAGNATQSNTQQTFSIASDILFRSAQYELSPEAKDELYKTAADIKRIVGEDNAWHVAIEGHTDDMRVVIPKITDNWELSTKRALSVVRFFIREELFLPQQLSAVGYGDSKPLAPNRFHENRAKNRRIEFRLIKTK